MAIEYPKNSFLGANVNSFPKKQYEKIVEIIDEVNDLIDGAVTTDDLTLTDDLVVGGDAAVTGVTNLTGLATLTAGATFGAANTYKAATTLTALAGGAQAGTAISAEFSEFTVVATALDSAQLPVAALGKRYIVTNSATTKLPMVVFGQTGATINTGAANAGFIIGYGETVIFTGISATAWKTNSNSASATVGDIITEEVTLTATEIVGTSAGDIGHASGATLIAAPGAGYVLELVKAVFIYDFATAAYTGGANDAIIAYASGAAVTSAITSANLLTAATDKLLTLAPIATEVVPVANAPLSLRGTAYTQPGTAAGVLRVQVSYRIHKTGL